MASVKRKLSLHLTVAIFVLAAVVGFLIVNLKHSRQFAHPSQSVRMLPGGATLMKGRYPSSSDLVSIWVQVRNGEPVPFAWSRGHDGIHRLTHVGSSCNYIYGLVSDDGEGSIAFAVDTTTGKWEYIVPTSQLEVLIDSTGCKENVVMYALDSDFFPFTVTDYRQ